MLENAPTTRFKDVLTSDEAYVFVRYSASRIAVGLALMANGDIEAVMGMDEGKALLEAVQVAVAAGEGGLDKPSARGNGPLVLREAALIRFSNLGEAEPDQGWLIVRYDDCLVAIGMFLKSGGGIEVVMVQEAARSLLESLQIAIGALARDDRSRELLRDANEQPVAKNAAIIKFSDLMSGETWAIVRHDDTCVAVYFLVQSEGGTEVAMRRDDARSLMQVLQIALAE